MEQNYGRVKKTFKNRFDNFSNDIQLYLYISMCIPDELIMIFGSANAEPKYIEFKYYCFCELIFNAFLYC